MNQFPAELRKQNLLLHAFVVCASTIFAAAIPPAVCASAQEPATATKPDSKAESKDEAQPETKFALASIFSDHMVLQREMPLPIWGTAAPGAKVTVALAGSTKEATADSAGKWRVDMPPLKTKGPLEMTVSSGDETLHLTDVLVGEVWLASGQSNMEWPVSKADNAKDEMAAADFSDIRAVTVPKHVAESPQEAFDSHGWQVCSPKTVGSFSAVGYFFARELHKQLDAPIGLIDCYWGGTPMEAWTSRDALQSNPPFAATVADDVTHPGKTAPPNRPAALFNGMLSPVIPYAIRGAIWYQGEANAPRHAQYRELSSLMIGDWRKRWGEGDFPFLLTQLAGWEPGGNDWPYLREAQTQTLEVPKTGMALAIDIGNRKDIHPTNKQEVGHRLSLASRAIAYGEGVEWSGPMYRSMKADDGKIRITFDHLGGGLKVHGDKLAGFEVAGADGKFAPAEATIDGDQVVVSSGEVKEPAATRYDWASFPDGNLYNAADLPAVPFRTDAVHDKSP